MMENIYSLFKVSGWIVIMLILFSCQKNIVLLSNTTPAPDTAVVVQVPGKPVSFDSLSFQSLKTPLLSIHDSYLREKIADKVTQFYKSNEYKTKWLAKNMPSYLFNELSAWIHQSADLGLQPDDYNISLLEGRTRTLYSQETITKEDIIGLDIQISEAFFLFSTHLQEGKIRSAGSNKAVWIRKEKQITHNDVTLLSRTTDAAQLCHLVTELQPDDAQYKALQRMLVRYHELEKTDLPLITMGNKERVKPYETHLIIPAVRKKLLLMKDLTIENANASTDSLFYDDALVSAVKHFQTRHGLEHDGIIGEKTIKFLNQSFKEKAATIALNMERIKWSSDINEKDYIQVNIPEFKLRLFQDQKKQLEMNVIVGSADKPTPVFNDVLEYLVFSPTWTVPHSILKEEMIPHLKRDSLYYTQKNYMFYKNEEVIDPSLEAWRDQSINPYRYKVVQQPGPDNALGLVKFIMPNHMNVYLHDTNGHYLFSKIYRALSHGCIRLSEPAKLAVCLLKYQKGWNAEAINKAMHGNEPYTLLLKNHCPVKIEYHTAWVDDKGELNFREDIYEHDQNQIKQLRQVENTSSLVGI